MIFIVGAALAIAAAAATSADESCAADNSVALDTELNELLADSHSQYCARRLDLVRRAGRLPSFVAYPALQDKNVRTVFPVEQCWREEFYSLGYKWTSSVVSATFIISKQQKHALLPFGGVCPETQLFNHIRGQEAWVDKLNLTRALRSAGLGHLQPTTFIFGADASPREARDELHELDAFLASHDAMPADAQPDGADVGWIHKRRSVENSRGITLLSWADLRRRRAAGDSSFLPWLTPGVLQRYIAKPLLLDGHKADLRCFVLVASVKPLAAFFFDEFMARRSPQPYEPTATDPNEGALTAASHHALVASVKPLAAFFDEFMARRSPQPYEPTATDPNESALTAAPHLALPKVQSVETSLHAAQFSPERFAQTLHAGGQLPRKSSDDDGLSSPPEHWLRATFLPQLMSLCSGALQAVLPSFDDSPGYFSIYGLDVLVDAELHTYFSEMNFSPQLTDTGAAAWKRGLNRRIAHEMLELQEIVLEARSLPESSGGVPRMVERLRERAKSFRPLALEGEEGVRWYHSYDGEL